MINEIHFLLSSFRYLFTWLESEDIGARTSDQEWTTLANLMKCFGYLVRIIVTAKDQCDNAPSRRSTPVKAGQTLADIQSGQDEEFREALRQLIWFIDALMLKKVPVQIVAIQNHTLNHFSDVFAHLKNVFPPADLGDLARGFLDSIPLANSAHVNHAKVRKHHYSLFPTPPCSTIENMIYFGLKKTNI